MFISLFLLASTISWYVAAMFAGDDLKLYITRLFLCLFNMIALTGSALMWLMRRIAAGKDKAVNDELAAREGKE